jgi:hypothetical protein
VFNFYKELNAPFTFIIHKINGGVYIKPDSINDPYVWDLIDDFYNIHTFRQVEFHNKIYWVPQLLVDYFYSNEDGKESYLFDRMLKDKVHYDINTGKLIQYNTVEGNINLNAKYLFWMKEKRMERIDRGDYLTNKEGKRILPINVDVKNLAILNEEGINKTYNNNLDITTYLVDSIKDIYSILSTKPAIQGSPLDAASSSKGQKLQEDIKAKNDLFKDYLTKTDDEESYTSKNAKIMAELRIK